MLRYFKNKYNNYFTNNAEQLVITNDNLNYNQKVWQFRIDILSIIIEHLLDDLKAIYALYGTSKIFDSKKFHFSESFLKKFYFSESFMNIFHQPSINNITIISIKNFEIELPQNQNQIIEINAPLYLLYNLINSVDFEQFELISCRFKYNNFNAFTGLDKNKTIKKLYLHNIIGLNYSWFMPCVFGHGIIDEIYLYNSPDINSDIKLLNDMKIGIDHIQTVLFKITIDHQSNDIMEIVCEKLSAYFDKNLLDNSTCKINKISMINCNISEIFFYILMKYSSKTNITTIDLSYNLITKDCNNFVSNCLQTFTNLKTLNLTGNPINIDQVNIWRNINRNIDILF
jgi:hypothetical protein